MKFPDPVLPSKEAYEKRIERKNSLIKSLIQASVVRGAIVVAELIGVVLFDSSALLMDAFATLFDIASSLVLIYFIYYAAKPPDKNHPFGHGRLEPIVGLQLSFVLGLAGLVMLIWQTTKSFDLSHPTIPAWGWIIPASGMVLLEICYQRLKYIAKKEDSPALMVDARHFRVDAITSLIATLSLIVAIASPEAGVIGDHLGGIFIALFMIYLGVKSCRENVSELMDEAPNPEYFDRVRKAALSIPGVQATEKINIQHYGPDSHVDIDIEVDPNMPVDEAHKISQKVRAAIKSSWPKVRDVTVHVEPFYPGDHDD